MKRTLILSLLAALLLTSWAGGKKTKTSKTKAKATAVADTATASASKKSADTHNLDVAKQLEIFSTIYRDLDMMYVDTLNPKTVVETGINAMLNSLDPYTVYYPQADVKELKQMLTGKYGGIGSVISYDFQTKCAIINEPYYGMPAQEAGLRKGDVILSIDDEDMTDKGTPYVSEHLRGDAGTSFMLKYQRPGQKKPTTVKMTRRAIQMPALPYYGMLTDSIGYINLNQFTEDCSKEFRHAVIDLKRKGMQQLVIDLRNNGGGSLSEAVNILNLFLPKDLTLVKTKGKLERANREYRTEALPVDTVMPLLVLVNGNTASASEITCGTLQDLDRGVVMGTKTFGKGLVQVPLELPYNGNLKLTTAHYYIPSGRCIQAINYKHSKGEKNEVVADSLRREFRTAHGRTVKDGGGIMPDIVVEPDSMPNIVFYLSSAGLDSTNVMTHYVVDYVQKHPVIGPARTFQITDEDFADFKQRAITAGFKYDRESEKFLRDLIKVAKFEGYYDRSKAEFDALEQKLKHDLSQEMDFHKDMIKEAITSDIVPCYYYQAGGIENSLQFDKQVKEAVKLLRDRQRYDKILKPDK